MFLTDFHTRKYTRGIILQVGIFLTVTPGSVVLESTHGDGEDKFNKGILWCPHIHQAS